MNAWSSRGVGYWMLCRAQTLRGLKLSPLMSTAQACERSWRRWRRPMLEGSIRLAKRLGLVAVAEGSKRSRIWTFLARLKRCGNKISHRPADAESGPPGLEGRVGKSAVNAVCIMNRSPADLKMLVVTDHVGDPGQVCGQLKVCTRDCERQRWRKRRCGLRRMRAGRSGSCLGQAAESERHFLALYRAVASALVAQGS
jgi:hypothetical protein